MLTIDWEKLLAPIANDECLRYEGTYDLIQQARREDPNLPDKFRQGEPKKADWEEVMEICLDALQTRSKDLQIAMWLLEAWLHLYGFPGVREGLGLFLGLCERFWETRYPELNGEDLDYRIPMIDWMNRKLSAKLKLIPITCPEPGSHLPSCSWLDFEESRYLEKLAQKDPEIFDSVEAEGKVTEAQFYESTMLSPTAYYVPLAEELSVIRDMTVALEGFLNEKFSDREVSLVQFRETLEEIQNFATGILKERNEVDSYSGNLDDLHRLDGNGEENGNGGDNPETSDRTPPIRSRSEAYRRLAEAAEYLSQIEPHSPTPYLVRRAISWGRMTFTQLIDELLKDSNDLRAIYSLLGIREGGGDRN